MYSGYRTIFWGLFFSTFRINLGTLQILPAFVGWLIVAHGVNLINQDSNIASFWKSYKYALLLVLIMIIGPGLSLFGIEHELLVYWPILFAIIELLFIYHLLVGSDEYFNAGLERQEEVDCLGTLRVFMLLFIITTILECIMFTIPNSTLTFVVTIASFGLVLWLMYIVSFLKKQCA